MGSTSCVKCGANLIPNSFCSICGEVLYFKCSSCSMNTDERIHAYCHQLDSLDSNQNVYSKDSQLIKNYSNNQNQFTKIKLSSIKLSTIYWSNIFEFIKLVNKYWADAFSITIKSSTEAAYNNAPNCNFLIGMKII